MPPQDLERLAREALGLIPPAPRAGEPVSVGATSPYQDEEETEGERLKRLAREALGMTSPSTAEGQPVTVEMTERYREPSPPLSPWVDPTPAPQRAAAERMALYGETGALPTEAAFESAVMAQPPGLRATERRAQRSREFRPEISKEEALARELLGVGPMERAGRSVGRGIADLSRSLNEMVADGLIAPVREWAERAATGEQSVDAAKPLFKALAGIARELEAPFAAAAEEGTLEERYQPTGQETILDHVLAAAPNLGAFLALGTATGGSAVLPLAAAFEYGAASLEAREKGATPEERRLAATMTGAVNGLLESTGVERVLSGIFKAIPKGELRKLGAEILSASLVEGGTETLQELAGQLSAAASYAGEQGMTWNDFRDAFSAENLKRYGLAGTVGFILGGGAVAAGRGAPMAAEAAGRVAERAREAFPPRAPTEDTQEVEIPREAPREEAEKAPEAAPVEAMEHAGVAASPEAISREAGGTRFYRVRTDGEAVPLIGTDAVDAPVGRGEVKVRVSPDGTQTVEEGRPTAKQQTTIETLRPGRVRETGPTEVQEIQGDESDADFLKEMGVKTKPAPVPRETEPAAPAPREEVPSAPLPEEEAQEAPQAEEARPEEEAPAPAVLKRPAAEVAEVSPQQLELAPERFQYKVEGRGALGETGSLRGVRRWDPNLAGVVQVWQDPGDGKTYVVNGHNRVVKARELGVDNLLVRYIDAPSAQEARAIGALTNIAEGAGTSADAAKFFRDSQFTPEMVEELGLPLAQSKVTEGIGLAGLDNWIFNQVVQGTMPVQRGALIGRELAGDSAAQASLMKLLDRQEKRGRRLTNDQLGELIEEVKGLPTTEGAQQGFDFAGPEEESIAVERAGVSSYIRRRLSREQRLFGVVSRARNAAELEEAGNRINRETSEKMSREASMLIAHFNAAKSGTEIGPVLTEAARRIANGEDAKKVQQETYERVRESLQSSLGGATEEGRAGGEEAPGRPEGEEEQGGLFGGSTKASVGRYAARPAVDIKDPELRKFYFRNVRKMHPDFASDEDDRQKRTLFTQEFNAAAERGDRRRMESIVEAWEKGDERPPGSTRRGPTPRRPRTEKQQAKEREEKAEDVPPPPRRKPKETQPGRLPLILPEMVEIVQSLAGGRIPLHIKKILRVGRQAALGTFQGGGKKGPRINLVSWLAQEPEQAAAVLAHEIGHWADYIPQMTFARGNLFGSIASLKRYMKKMLDEVPTSPSRVFTRKEMTKWYREAERQAKQELGKDAPKEEIRKLRTRYYRERLQQEMDLRGLVDLETILDEAWDLSVRWRPLPEGAGKRHLRYRRDPRELYADLFSAILNDPEMVKRVAPGVHELFFNYLSRKPEVAEPYLVIQERILEGEEPRIDSIAERYLHSVKKGGIARALEMVRRAKESPGATLAESLVDGLLDRKSILYEERREARKKGATIRPEKDPVLWAEEMAYGTGRAAAYLDRFSELVLYPVRAAGIEDHEIGALMALRRAAGERRDLFSPLGVQGKIADDVRKHIEEKLGPEKSAVVKRALENWWQVRQSVLDELEESEALSDSLMEKLRTNPEYARFTVQSFIEEESRRHGRAGGLSALKQQIGTVQEIGNPLVETALTDIALLRYAHRQSTASALVDFYKDNNPEEIEDAKRGAGGRFLDIDEPTRKTLFYMKKGKMQAHHLPKRAVESIEHHMEWGAGYQTFMTWFHNPLRQLLVERNPGWWIWNLARDTEAFQKQVVKGGPVTSSIRTLKYLWKAAPDAFQLVFRGKSTETVREMLEGRMMVQPGQRFYRAGEMAETDAIDELLTHYSVIEPSGHERNVLLRLVEKLWEWLGRPGAFSERLVKIAGYKYLREQHPELHRKEIAHIVRTRAGTPDVYRRGKWFKATNSVFLFSNVAKEGWRSSFTALKEEPWEFALKTVTNSILVPKLLLAAAAAGLLGDELREVIERIPDHDKRNYLIIPWGLDEKGRAVYTRIPYDHFGQAVSGLAWVIASSPEKVDDLAKWLDEGTPYSPASFHPMLEVALASWTYLGRGENPPDRFLGRPIIPQKIYEAGPRSKESVAAFSRWMWNQLGGRAVLQLRLDVDQLDPRPPTSIERASEWWFLGPIVGRLLKVSDYGLTEQIRKATEEAEKQSASKSLNRERFIMQALDSQEKPTVLDIHRGMKELGIEYERIGDLRDRVEQLKKRYSGNPLERAESYAGSKAEREALEKFREGQE